MGNTAPICIDRIFLAFFIFKGFALFSFLLTQSVQSRLASEFALSASALLSSTPHARCLDDGCAAMLGSCLFF